MSSFSIATNHRIIGVGNAGINFLDRLLLAAPSSSGLVAVNNDSESLMASVVATQISLASEEASLETPSFSEMPQQLMEEIEKASLVVLTGGLGGQFGSRLLPEIAAKSKAAKKITVACVSLPFSFEGKRTQTLAAESLAALQKSCDGILLLENDRLCATSPSTAALGETFAASDAAMEVCLPALVRMLFSKGPVRITRSDLLKALRSIGSKTHFGYGEATGANRLHEAMERVFKNPLLDRGRCLAKADSIFLLLHGPKDISFAEAQAAMQELERLAPADHDIQMSVHAEAPDGAPLQIFLLAVTGGALSASAVQKLVQEPAVPKKISPPPQPVKKIPPPLEAPVEATSPDREKKDLLSEEAKELFPTTLYEPSVETNTTKIPKTPAASKVKQTQGALNLKTIQRGRFDKSEPTIVEGEDLDTPTYLRLGLNLKT